MNIIYLIDSQRLDRKTRYAFDLCRYMRHQGHNVAVVTRNTEPVTSLFRKHNIDVDTAPLKGAFDIASPVIVARKLRKNPAPTIIHAQSKSTAAIAERARMLAGDTPVKVIYTMRSVPDTSAPVKGILQESDCVVLPSQYMLELCKPVLDEITGVNYVTISDFPDPEYYTEESTIATPVKNFDSLTMAMCGELTAECGLDLIVAAMKILKGRNMRLIVAGTGDGRTVMPIIREARRLGIDSRIEWKGETFNLQSIMDSADLGLCLSKTPYISPAPILQFLSEGVPVIATKCAVSEALVDGKDGVLIAPEAGELADAIASMGGQSERLKEMGEAARQKAGQEGSFEQFARSIADVYAQCLK